MKGCAWHSSILVRYKITCCVWDEGFVGTNYFFRRLIFKKKIVSPQLQRILDIKIRNGNSASYPPSPFLFLAVLLPARYSLFHKLPYFGIIDLNKVYACGQG